MNDKQIIIDKDKFEKAENEPINQEAVNKFIEQTDKFYIDGVDASECINFRPNVDTAQVSYTNACSIGIWQRWYSNIEPSCIMSCSCKDNSNCYYKQLKRKEQECEELKERLNCNCFDPKNNNNRCISYNRIAEDYERVLKQLESTKGLVTVGNKQYTQVLTAYDKIKSVLKTIKEIAYDGYNNGQTSYATFQCEKIIDIINEVE